MSNTQKKAALIIVDELTSTGESILVLKRLKALDAVDDDDLVTLSQLKMQDQGNVRAESDNVFTGSNQFEEPVTGVEAELEYQLPTLGQVLALLEQFVVTGQNVYLKALNTPEDFFGPGSIIWLDGGGNEISKLFIPLLPDKSGSMREPYFMPDPSKPNEYYRIFHANNVKPLVDEIYLQFSKLITRSTDNIVPINGSKEVTVPELIGEDIVLEEIRIGGTTSYTPGIAANELKKKVTYNPVNGKVTFENPLYDFVTVKYRNNSVSITPPENPDGSFPYTFTYTFS